MKKVLLASSALATSVGVTAPATAEVTWNAFTMFFASSSYEKNDGHPDSGDIRDFSTKL